MPISAPRRTIRGSVLEWMVGARRSCFKITHHERRAPIGTVDTAVRPAVRRSGSGSAECPRAGCRSSGARRRRRRGRRSDPVIAIVPWSVRHVLELLHGLLESRRAVHRLPAELIVVSDRHRPWCVSPWGARPRGGSRASHRSATGWRSPSRHSPLRLARAVLERSGGALTVVAPPGATTTVVVRLGIGDRLA